MPLNAGWSPSDLLKLVEYGIKSYRLWKNAPGDAKGLLQKLEYLATQLNFPNDLLEQVGHEEYPHTKELKQDLEAHDAYFKRFSNLTEENKALTSRLTETIKWKWKEDVLTRIKDNIEYYLDMLRDFRQDLIL